MVGSQKNCHHKGSSVWTQIKLCLGYKGYIQIFTPIILSLGPVVLTTVRSLSLLTIFYPFFFHIQSLQLPSSTRNFLQNQLCTTIFGVPITVCHGHLKKSAFFAEKFQQLFKSFGKTIKKVFFFLPLYVTKLLMFPKEFTLNNWTQTLDSIQQL